jgi:hypothetical protein
VAENSQPGRSARERGVHFGSVMVPSMSTTTGRRNGVRAAFGNVLPRSLPGSGSVTRRCSDSYVRKQAWVWKYIDQRRLEGVWHHFESRPKRKPTIVTAMYLNGRGQEHSQLSRAFRPQIGSEIRKSWWECLGTRLEMLGSRAPFIIQVVMLIYMLLIITEPAGKTVNISAHEEFHPTLTGQA